MSTTPAAPFISYFNTKDSIVQYEPISREGVFPHDRLDDFQYLVMSIKDFQEGIDIKLYDDKVQLIVLILTPIIILLTAFCSAYVESIIFVTAFIPVANALVQQVFWLALLFDACFGHNITALVRPSTSWSRE